MRINEIKEFYKNASKEQIQRLVESSNDSGMSNEVITEIIYAANHEEWTTHSPDQLIESIRAMTNGKSSS